jgi:N-acetylglucosaminyl-diphospho-decaprenol L-rhamnosyltransferase
MDKTIIMMICKTKFHPVGDCAGNALGGRMDLSIIIVNWNTLPLLRICLASIFDASLCGLTMEVIVVDNGSSDGSVDMVKREFPSVQLVTNTTNIGFAWAANQGIRWSAGDFVLLLNSDIIVEKQTLSALMEFMKVHKDAGMCGARLMRSDGSVQPYLFGSDPTLSYLIRRGLKRLFLRKALHDWETKDIMEVDWVSGACLIARREALSAVGLLDENIFMYFEDTDLCLRARLFGWKVYYNPTATVIHLGGQSSNDKERRKVYFESLLYFYKKHYILSYFVLNSMLFPYRRLCLRAWTCSQRNAPPKT